MEKTLRETIVEIKQLLTQLVAAQGSCQLQHCPNPVGDDSKKGYCNYHRYLG